MTEIFNDEPLLQKESRYNISPMLYPDIFNFYEKMRLQGNWIPNEVDLSEDKFDELPDSQKLMLKMLLAFFFASDTIVNRNIEGNIISNIEILEIKMFYAEQMKNEFVHSDMYRILVETYIKDVNELADLQKGIEDMPAVKEKAAFAFKWLGQGTPIEQIVAFSIVEMLSFQSTFAPIFVFRQKNKMKGLCEANTFVMKDESFHGEFAVYLYNTYVKNKLTDEKVMEMVDDCLRVEYNFVDEVIDDSFMSKKDLKEYLGFIRDNILNMYNINVSIRKNPLEFMEALAIPRKPNFFEKRVSNYAGAIGINTNIQEDF